ncbi:MAG: acylneuraminate cytidylyltransferase family protein, partial [Muribaculaceae bacterium]
HISKGDGLYTRRQDAPKTWEYNGAVYVINSTSLRKMHLGQFTHRIMSEMPSNRSIDLDTSTDWLIAETLLKQNV